MFGGVFRGMYGGVLRGVLGGVLGGITKDTKLKLRFGFVGTINHRIIVRYTY